MEMEVIGNTCINDLDIITEEVIDNTCINYVDILTEVADVFLGRLFGHHHDLVTEDALYFLHRGRVHPRLSVFARACP